MKKSTAIVLLVLLCSCGNNSKKEYSAEDMAQADSLVERIKTEQLSHEPMVQDLASSVLDMKERLDTIRMRVVEADMLLENMDFEGHDVDELKSLMDDIMNECDK